MKKKIKEKVFLCLVFGLCILTGISAFFSKADASVEQRELSAFPEFIKEDGLNENFDSELSDWLSERMAVRKTALKIKTAVLDKVFKSSASDQVIIGKDGWLYFTPTVDEYICDNTLSERSINNIADTLEQINEYCNKNSVKFLFAAVPNKNTLYGENMPSRFIRGDLNNYDRLSAVLENSDVPSVDFRSFNTKSDSPLYYKTDTHWNVYGASLACDLMLTKLEKEHTDFHNLNTVESEKIGDLMKMLYPESPDPEKENVPDYEFTYKYTSRFKSEEDINITTENTNADSSLLMFRDSFGNALLPFMAESFSSARFSRAVPIDLSSIEKDGTDTVIYEIVQRNLKNIILYAPIIPAEKCRLTVDRTEKDAVVSVKTETAEYIHIFGDVSKGLLNSTADIYVSLIGSDSEKSFYRCFNICENSLYDDGIVRDNGFSCRIKAADLKNGKYKIGVCIKTSSGVTEIISDETVTVNN